MAVLYISSESVRWISFLLAGILGLCLGSCPEGFTSYKTLGPCYRVFLEFKNWTDARAICRSFHADLVKVDDNETYVAMAGITSDISKYYWMNLNDLITENSFYWLDGSPLQNPKWDPAHSQPNGADEQNCVVGNAKNNLWEDKKCIDKYPFVCEHLEVPGGHIVTNTHVAVSMTSEGEIRQQHNLGRQFALGVEDCLRHCLSITECDRFTYNADKSISTENCFLGFFGPRTSDFLSGQGTFSYILRES